MSLRLITSGAALHIARNLRECDAEEIKVWTGDDPVEHVYWNGVDAKLAWSIQNKDGEPVCMFGAEDDEDGLGLTWMFSTDKVSEAKWTLCRHVRECIEKSRIYWPKLRISHDYRKDDKRRFMEFCGFKWVRDFDVNGHLFREMQV